MADWAGLCVATSLLVVLLTAAGYALYSGLLSDITVLTGSPPIKKITFVYKFKKGPYESCGELFKESRGIGPKLSRIGVYYDDPKKVPGPQCRSAVGSILSEGEDQADEELLRSYETSGFKVFSFPEVTHVVTASFPHRTFFSVLLGMRRVYPRLEDHIKARRLCAHPFLEIYREGLIQFMAPLARQGDFYVPEIRQAERRLLEREDFHSDSEGSGHFLCASSSGLRSITECHVETLTHTHKKVDKTTHGCETDRVRSTMKNRGVDWWSCLCEPE
uniref:Testis expressed 264, ER-phagy receptor n=1 Tax=Gasterosteus aculeatus aculeatus TaxID=481459 RepID=A0AAQ4QS96_GASAC